MVGKTYCPYTQRAKAALHELGLQPSILDVDVTPNGGALQQAFSEVSGIKTVPQVFVGGECVGGCDATLKSAPPRACPWPPERTSSCAAGRSDANAMQTPQWRV